MPTTPRQRFGNFQDWHEYVQSLADPAGNVQLNGEGLRDLRYACYKDIQALRGRPLLVYAVNFPSQLPPNAPISIDLSDVDGFTDLINSVDSSVREVDVLIHSPGGVPDATERIVRLLRARFDEVHFLVPHSAYSAATMLAMSGNTITLHPSAILGPIDPQINGVPARQIKRAFTNLQKKVAEEGQESIVVYLPLIEKYDLYVLEMCDDAEKLSKSLVKEWLKAYMLKDIQARPKNTIATKATSYMADFDKHLMHSRSLDTAKLVGFGLKIESAEQELASLLREAHILLAGTFNGLGFVKIFESPEKLSWGAQIQIIGVPRPQ